MWLGLRHHLVATIAARSRLIRGQGNRKYLFATFRREEIFQESILTLVFPALEGMNKGVLGVK
jgi:hypothetical protein